jgi:class 3 adenylate cyclase
MDLVVVGGGGPIPIDLLWDDPGFIRIAKGLSRFSRTIWFEFRGWGSSEGIRQDDEVFHSDLAAVLDAVGADRPALLGAHISCSAAIHFASKHPERIRALVLFNGHAHYVREDDYPWGFAHEDLEFVEDFTRERWGTKELLEYLDPNRITDESYKARMARLARVGGGPDQIAKAMRAAYERDDRRLLPTISVPTLVLHRVDNRVIHQGAGRYLAEHIPGAKFVALPGDEYPIAMGDTDSIVDEIEEFLTGARSGAEADMVTAAVLFTDIVASTEQQSRLGPRAWSRICERHDAMVREALTRHRGREVKTTGDGFLTTFESTGRAIRCATSILSDAKDIGLQLRVGVHTGEVEVRGNDIGGLTVSIAKRVCDLAMPDEALLSESARLAVTGSGIEFEDRGEHELKGVPGTWHLFAVST